MLSNLQSRCFKSSNMVLSGGISESPKSILLALAKESLGARFLSCNSGCHLGPNLHSCARFVLTHAEHGSLRSHLIFLRLQLKHTKDGLFLVFGLSLRAPRSSFCISRLVILGSLISRDAISRYFDTERGVPMALSSPQ